jgi:hypothetical protein
MDVCVHTQLKRLLGGYLSNIYIGWLRSHLLLDYWRLQLENKLG